ncbi:MAG: hypothetical protein FJ116_04260 [Deltaproteobacteria bacterium]|nr:hypothetical protein [Deltaproteobacteria bacterium]
MKFVALLSLLVVTNIYAGEFPKNSLLTCNVVVNNHSNIIKIGIQDLGTSKAKLLNLGKTEEQGPILFSEKNKEVGSNMNAQGGDLRVDKNTIELHGDDDGCSYIKLVLFKDSEYTHGWASESGSEVPHWYSKAVSCNVSELK